ncbi:hypothetical protein, partial [Glaesserella parasuis]|uniref:hypothetical protein n=1 Tax=Glaesserella parasuis TaxID=738 RepID=UPI0013653D61
MNKIKLIPWLYSIAPEYQTKVPMIMWFSKEWIKNEPFDLNCVRENAKTKTYSHDNYFHSVKKKKKKN